MSMKIFTPDMNVIDNFSLWERTNDIYTIKTNDKIKKDIS